MNQCHIAKPALNFKLNGLIIPVSQHPCLLDHIEVHGFRTGLKLGYTVKIVSNEGKLLGKNYMMVCM